MHTNEPQHTTTQLLEVIQVLTEIVQQGLDLEWVIGKITEKAQSVVQADGAVIEMVDTETDEMVYRAVSGLASGQLGLRLQRATSLSGMSVSQAKVLYCEDSETDPRVNVEACRRVGLRSMICVPLFHEQRAIGVLKVFSSRPSGFKEHDLLVLQLITEVIASTLSNATKYSDGEIFRQAKLDQLTGLANRFRFDEKIQQVMSQTRDNGGIFGLLMIDMDGLKPINDEEGHRTGDAALKAIASRISGCIRQTDTVARLGGDEFAVILVGIERSDDVYLAAKRIEAHCNQPYSFEGKSLSISVSVGAASYPQDGDKPEMLLHQADTRMYNAKRHRKGAGVLKQF